MTEASFAGLNKLPGKKFKEEIFMQNCESSSFAETFFRARPALAKVKHFVFKGKSGI